MVLIVVQSEVISTIVNDPISPFYYMYKNEYVST